MCFRAHTCVDTNISAHQCSSYTPTARTAVCLITHEIWSQSLTSPKSPTFYMLCLLLSHSIDPIMKMLRNLRICLIKYQIKWSDLIFISVYLQNPSQVRFLSAFLSLSIVQIKDQSFIWEMRLSPLSSVWCIPTQSGFGVSIMFHFIFRNLPELEQNMNWKSWVNDQGIL